MQNKLTLFREKMKENDLTAFIIPTDDPHKSEYVAGYWKTRVWITGFTGSAGTAVVTLDNAGLWTDGRYFVQAEQELTGSEFVLQKMGEPGVLNYDKWLLKNLKTGDKVGLDFRLFSVEEIDKMNTLFQEKGIELVNYGFIIDEMWQDRPEMPLDKFFELDTKYTGESRADKLKKIVTALEENNGDYFIFARLDDIAWLLNIRGNDVAYSPVVISYMLVGKDKSFFFVKKEKVTKEIAESFEKDNIEVRDYSEIDEFLNNLEDKAIMYNKNDINKHLFDCAKDKNNMIDCASLVINLKACKNETEIENIRQVMVKDGVALVRFFKWLDENIDKEKISEVKVAEKLIELRGLGEDFIGPSFATIAGYKGHGAIIHYKATEESAYTLEREGIFLLDSGGQYLGGTTDITRTIALSEPSVEQKRNYTLVLKGHLRLGNAVFPKGTKGFQLDTLARMDLWQEKKNYNHGTGHGVGHFLNVHEGPQSISPRLIDVALERGMLLSNEPGIYFTNEYGIRIENLIIVEEIEGSDFLRFENLTLCPYDKNLIDFSLLADAELSWLKEYNQVIYEKFASLMTDEELKWMKENILF